MAWMRAIFEMPFAFAQWSSAIRADELHHNERPTDTSWRLQNLRHRWPQWPCAPLPTCKERYPVFQQNQARSRDRSSSLGIYCAASRQQLQEYSGPELCAIPDQPFTTCCSSTTMAAYSNADWMDSRLSSG